MDERREGLNGRLLFGLVLVTLGGLWTLDNLGIANAGEVLRWWPLLVLAYGLMKITGVGFGRNVVSGGFFALIGGLLLAHRFGWIRVGFELIWPLILILLGVQIVLRATRGGRPDDGPADRQEWIRAFALMGGASRRSLSTQLRGAELSAVMGGVELDLREAKPAAERVVVDVFAWWGGIEVVVPENWRVESDVTPVMGTFEDDRNLATTEEPVATLVLRGTVIMGGVVVRNQPQPHQVVIGVSRRRRRRDRDDDEREVRVSPAGVFVRKKSASGEEREVRIDAPGFGSRIHVTTRPAPGAAPGTPPGAPPSPPPPEPVDPS